MAEKTNPFTCPADKRLSSHKEDKVSCYPKATRDCPSSYEIVNDPMKAALSKIAPKRIGVIAEKEANHDGHRSVLFWDGSVRAFDNAQFNRLKDNSFIDVQDSETKH